MTRKCSPQELAKDSFSHRMKQANALVFSSALLEGGMLQIANGNGELLDAILGPQLVISEKSPEVLPLEFGGGLVYTLGVLKAFTVELYLKSLLHLERNDPPQKHDLLKLFRSLGFKDKRLLEDMRKVVIAGPSFSNATPELHKDLETTLMHHRRDFVDIRYQEMPGPQTLVKATDGMSNMSAAVYSCMLACLSKPEARGLLNHINPGLRSVLKKATSVDLQ